MPIIFVRRWNTYHCKERVRRIADTGFVHGARSCGRKFARCAGICLSLKGSIFVR